MHSFSLVIIQIVPFVIHSKCRKAHPCFWDLKQSWTKGIRFIHCPLHGTESHVFLLITKRYKVSGLQNATVRIYADDHITAKDFHAYLNANYPWKEGKISFKEGDPALGKHFVVENITGSLVVSW